MRLWRRKSDGFEWHKHVRTTVKLRREDRRRRIEGAKVAAVEGVKGVGRAGISAGSSGLALAGDLGKSAINAGQEGVARGAALAQNGLVRGASAVKDGVARCASAGWQRFRLFSASIPPAAARAWRTISDFTRHSARGPLQRAGVQPVLLAIAAIAGVVAATGWMQAGFSIAVGVAALIAILGVVTAALPVLIGGQRVSFRWVRDVPAWLSLQAERIPWPRQMRSNRLAQVSGVAAIALLIVGGVAAASWTVWRGTTYLASASGIPGLSSRIVEGRARAISGDTLRIGATTVRLAGIEAPGRAQRCSRPGNRRWRCGQSAQDALARAVRSGPVRCTVTRTDDAGRALGTCTSGDRDIAEGLVRGGHVFAEGGLFASYAAFEKEAQAAKLGLWRGEAERPSEVRTRAADEQARAWEVARKSAPNGCPIKGQLVSGQRFYVVPGTADYGRIRIRSDRGERWFCSEQEAAAAGWKPSPRT